MRTRPATAKLDWVIGGIAVMLSLVAGFPAAASAAPYVCAANPATIHPPDYPQGIAPSAYPGAEAGVAQIEPTTAVQPLGANIIGDGTANPYYEIGAPSGSFLNSTPVGVMVLIHGGGWTVVGPATTDFVRPDADRWRARGWATFNIDYPACAASVNAVYQIYQRIRGFVGAGTPVCAEGQSAGGELALILAGLTNVSCVISEAGIADFATLNHDESAYPPDPLNPADPLNAELSAQALYDDSLLVFPQPLLDAVSPSTYAQYIRAPLLLADAATDVIIPTAQGQDLADLVHQHNPQAVVDVDTLALPADPTLGMNTSGIPFVHGCVAHGSLTAFYQQEQALVAPLMPSTYVPPLTVSRWPAVGPCTLANPAGL